MTNAKGLDGASHRCCLCPAPIGYADRGYSFSGENIMNTDPVDARNKLRRTDEDLQRTVTADSDAAIYLSDAVKKFGEEGFREKFGDTEFNHLMRLARMREELGEEQFKLVRFRELKAMMVADPDQN
jgi:hypothetical protein